MSSETPAAGKVLKLFVAWIILVFILTPIATHTPLGIIADGTMLLIAISLVVGAMQGDANAAR